MQKKWGLLSLGFLVVWALTLSHRPLYAPPEPTPGTMIEPLGFEFSKGDVVFPVTLALEALGFENEIPTQTGRYRFVKIEGARGVTIAFTVPWLSMQSLLERGVLQHWDSGVWVSVFLTEKRNGGEVPGEGSILTVDFLRVDSIYRIFNWLVEQSYISDEMHPRLDERFADTRSWRVRAREMLLRHNFTPSLEVSHALVWRHERAIARYKNYTIQLRLLDSLHNQSVLCEVKFTGNNLMGQTTKTVYLNLATYEALSVLSFLVEDITGGKKGEALEVMSRFERGEYYSAAVRSFEMRRGGELLSSLRTLLESLPDAKIVLEMGDLDANHRVVLAEFLSRSFLRNVSSVRGSRRAEIQKGDVSMALNRTRSSVTEVIDLHAEHLEANRALNAGLRLVLAELNDNLSHPEIVGRFKEVFLKEAFRSVRHR